VNRSSCHPVILSLFYLIQGEIEEKDIDAWLAEEAKLRPLNMTLNEIGYLRRVLVARGGYPVDLQAGRRRADVWVQTAG
jgi:hypothetical protein